MARMNVNTAVEGVSPFVAYQGEVLIIMTGEWNGGSVDLRQLSSDGETWQTIYSFTEDTIPPKIYDVVRQATLCFHTTGTPDLVCEVQVASGQI